MAYLNILSPHLPMESEEIFEKLEQSQYWKRENPACLFIAVPLHQPVLQ
jgi:hypothetical protein